MITYCMKTASDPLSKEAKLAEARALDPTVPLTCLSSFLAERLEKVRPLYRGDG